MRRRDSTGVGVVEGRREISSLRDEYSRYHCCQWEREARSWVTFWVRVVMWVERVVRWSFGGWDDMVGGVVCCRRVGRLTTDFMHVEGWEENERGKFWN